MLVFNGTVYLHGQRITVFYIDALYKFTLYFLTLVTYLLDLCEILFLLFAQ